MATGDTKSPHDGALGRPANLWLSQVRKIAARTTGETSGAFVALGGAHMRRSEAGPVDGRICGPLGEGVRKGIGGPRSIWAPRLAKEVGAQFPG